jgi:hypothetical protein
MASVDEAVRAFMERRGAPMTAENMNRARQFLTEQQPALLNSMMRDLDQGRNVTLAGRGTDLFDGGVSDTESQMDEFMRRSDGEQQSGSQGQQQQPPTPPQQPQQRPQQARQSGAPQGTPPTPPRMPQGNAQVGQPQQTGGGQGGTGEQSAQGGDDSMSIPGASGDSLTDEIIMAMAGARAAGAPTRAPRGAQVNTEMPRPGSANQGPQTSASQPRIENVQEAQQVNDNLPAQQGGQQQSQASQALPGADQRAQMQGPQGQQQLQGRTPQPQVSGEQRPQLQGPADDVARKGIAARNAAQMTQAVNQGEMGIENVANLLEYQQISQVEGPNGPERVAVFNNTEGDTFMVGVQSGQVYMDGQPLDGVQFTPERVTELFDATFPRGLSGAARAIGGAL